MKTLGKNADNDLYLEAGGLAILHDADAQCAVIESVLQTQRGELQFDPEGGIDYFGTVLQNPNNIDFWAGQVTTKIESLAFVSAVEDFQYRFDAKTSTLYWSMTVVTTDNVRLDLQNKKTVMDGSPGVQVDWKDIYDKPDNVDETLGMIQNMRDEAQELDELSDKSTLAITKEIFNRVVFDPNDKKYAESRQLKFTFAGVPLGTALDFSNLLLGLQNTGTETEPRYVPFTLEISDGTKIRNLTNPGGAPLSADGNKVWFSDETKEPDEEEPYPSTQKHVIMVGGAVEITLRGDITSISCQSPGKPIFLKSDGTPFPYLVGVVVGSRVPLKTIGDGAFRGFKNLQNIVWNGSESTYNITFGDYAFAGCETLSGLKWMPKRTKSIGEGCFKGCRSLQSLEGLVIESETEDGFALPREAFEGCSSLQTLAHIPPTITSLGERTFAGCESLKNLDDLGDGITSFGNHCFSGCTGLETILYLPDGLTSIGDGCFSELSIVEEGVGFLACQSLRSLFLSKKVSTIGSGAFAGCSSLSNVMCERDRPPTIAEDTFNQETLDIYVPIGSLTYYKAEVGWKKYWDGGIETIYEYGEFKVGLNGIKAGDTLLGNTSIIESNSIWQVEYVGSGAKVYRFENTTTALPEFTYSEIPSDEEDGISNVVLKGFIRRISAASSEAYPVITTSAGEETVQVVEIESHLSTSLERIGDYAFAGCINLTNVILQKSEVPFCLGDRAFYNCSHLSSTGWLNKRSNFGRTVEPAFGNGCFWKSGITKLSYPTAYVDSLPAYCFAETKIESLEGMGSGVLTSLGDHCFYGCVLLDGIGYLAPTGVTLLPEYCFANCSALRSISGIRKISALGAHCFENCTSLSTIEDIANADISALPAYAFAGCEQLTTLNGIEGIEKTDGTRTGITSLGEYSFAGCKALVDLSAIKNVHRTIVGASGVIEEIPAHCFDGCGVQTLAGCINITSIGERAFANCVDLLAPSGLGASITSIGDYAFENCTGLKHFSCLAQTAPSLGANAFSGVDTSNMVLYVRKGYETNYAGASVWGTVFAGRVFSRSITLSFGNINEITAAAASNTSVSSLLGYDKNDNPIAGVWFVDYGDGEGYVVYDGQETNLEQHAIGDAITLFGDISEISGKTAEDESKIPFLYGINSQVFGIDVQSPYLQKIGDCCFYNYGIEGQPLKVALNMAEGGEIGAYSFAKPADSTSGLLGTISACTAASLGDHAFEYSGVNSSAPFTHVTSAGAYAFANNVALTELTGFQSLVDVSEGMFAGCTGLTSTSGLSNVSSIGANAFDNCTALVTVRDFGDSLTTIGNNAFKGCNGITTIFMAMKTPPYLAADGFSVDVFENAIVYVPAGCVDDYIEANKQIKENNWYRFGDRLKSRFIEFMLSGVKKNDAIPEGICTVTATGNWTIFYEEDAAKGFAQYGAGSTDLPQYLFTSDHDKATIKISGPITSIRSNTENVCIFGTTLGDKLTSVKSTDAMEIVRIGANAFANCSNLETVEGFGRVKAVEANAFTNCAKLANVETFTGVITIGANAFNGCTSLSSLYGLSSVAEIGDEAFRDCGKLERIDGLGVNVSSIGAAAFANCPNLKEVQMFAELPPAESADAFDESVLATIPLYVRTKSISAYIGSDTWGRFADIRSRYVEFSLADTPYNLEVLGDKGKFISDTFWVVDWDSDQSDYGSGKPPRQEGGQPEQEESYLPGHVYTSSGSHTIRLEGAVTSISGVVSEDSALEPNPPTDITGTRFLMFGNGAEKDEYLKGVSRSEHSVLTAIGEASFLKNKGLTTTNLKGVKEIGRAAFAYTNIESCEMLESVSTIGECAFYGCKGINSVQNLGGDRIEIGSYAFAGLGTADGHPKYIQISVPDAANAEITDYSFGRFADAEAQNRVHVYVPMESVGSYQNENPTNLWRKFTIASRILQFTLENVPSGTRIIGLSQEDNVGTAKIQSDSSWTIDWGDGTRNTMSASDTSFPAHVYEYSEASRDYWQEQIIDGNSTWVRKTIVISISGSIRSLGCQSANDYPMLATTRAAGNPYLTKIEASEAMEELDAIGDHAFRGCSNLGSVSGFANVKTIGRYAFQGCTNLASVGNSLSGFSEATDVGNQAFADCTSLSSLVGFPKVLTIGIRSFANCISLPSTTGLGDAYSSEPYDTCPQAAFSAYAFEGCGFTLIDMTGYARPPVIQMTTFPGEPSEVYVSVPSESISIYKVAEVWKRYWESIIGEFSISITFNPGEIGQVVEGKAYNAVYGNNGRLSFSSDVLIDWGDGTPLQKSSVSSADEVTGWTFPNHIYSDGYSATSSVTIRLIGQVASLWTADTSLPFLALTTSTTETVVDATTGATTTVTSIGNERKYDYSLDSIVFRKGGGLHSIGEGCFSHRLSPSTYEGCNIGHLTFGQQQDSEYGGITIGANAFRACATLATITADDSTAIKQVGPYAFAGCTQLRSLRFLANCPIILNNAFEGCVGLTTTKDLAKVSTIGVSAFENCTGLEFIKLPASLISVAEAAFKGCSGILGNGIVWVEATDADTYIDPETEEQKKVLDNETITIGDEAFSGCTGANNEGWEVIIPSQVHSIGSAAFAGCGMKTFKWGNDDTDEEGTYTFSSGAVSVFEGCKNLETVTRLPRIELVPEKAFFNCAKLKDTAFLPSSVTSIGRSAFAQSSLNGGILLEQLTSLTTIASDAFFGCNAEQLSLPASAGLTIQARAFAYNTTLKTITWEIADSGNPPSIGFHCFEGCSGLTTINSFGGVRSLPDYCFFLCTSLVDISSVLDNAVDAIGNYCFAGCTSLSSITIPTAVTRLGEGCFSCSSEAFLRGFYDGNEPEEEAEFRNSYGTIADFERWMYRNYKDKRVDVWSVYEGICLVEGETVGPTSITWEANAGDAHSVGSACFMNCSRMILNGNFPLAEVPAFAFYNCSSLFNGEINGASFGTIVTNNTRVIGKFAFAHTNVLSLGNPSELERGYAILSPAVFLGCMALQDISAMGKIFGAVPSALPDAFFYGCSGLSNIGVLKADVPVKSLGNYCFAGCTSLDFGKEDGSIYDVMRQVAKIGDGCFAGCVCGAGGGSIVYMPRLVSYIPYRAFADNLNASQVVFSYSSEAGDTTASDITLEGDAFAGCSGITKITIPFPAVAKTVPAKGKIGNTDINSSDPFPAIPEAGEDPQNQKKQATIVVPGNLVGLYEEDEYWSKFQEIVPSGDVKDKVVQMDVKVPSGGCTMVLTGTIGIPDNGKAYVTWGDGSVTEIDADTDDVSHVYAAGTYTLIVSGAVTLLSGKVMSIGSSKYYIPLFSNSIDAASNSYVNSVVTHVTVIKAAYDTGDNPIGAYCFCNHESLNSVGFLNEVASSTTSIAAGTFLSCRNLTSIVGNLSSVVEIGAAAFKYTNSLSSLAFFTYNNTSSLTTVGAECFYGIGLADLTTLPASIANLGANAFAWCNSLLNLNGLQNLTGLTELPARCFRGCTKLNNIDALDSLRITSIPTGCFSACIALTSVANLHLSSIGVEGFADSGLISFAGINSDATVNARAFSGSKITLVGMPHIENIPEGCFKNCANITSLEGMYNGVTSLGTDCFAGSGLVSLNGMASGVVTLGDGCFEDCKGLTDVQLPNSVTSIGLRAFKGCEGINTITLSRDGIGETGITQIAEGGGVADQTDPETAPDFENRSFEYKIISSYSAFSISIPVDTYRTAYGWKNFFPA